MRLDARGAQHRDVVAEGEHRAAHDREQRGGGEPDGDGVEPGDRAVDEQAEPAGAERERDDDPPQPLVERQLLGAAHGLPGGGGDHDQAEPPADLEPVARLVGAVGGADEVERVGEPEGGDAAREQHPRAVELPAGAGERADDQAEQHEVGDRVGEADRDLHAPGRRRCRARSRRRARRWRPRRRARRSRRRPRACRGRRACGCAAASARRRASAAGRAGSRRRRARGSGSPPRSTGRPCSRSRRRSRRRRRRRSRARPGARGGRGERSRPRGTWRSAPTSTTSWAKREKQRAERRASGDQQDVELPGDQPEPPWRPR